MMIERTRKDFRYEGDAEEVTLRLSIEEARAIADACQEVTYDDSAKREYAEGLGSTLATFLDASEDSNAHVIHLRPPNPTEDSHEPHAS